MQQLTQRSGGGEDRSRTPQTGSCCFAPSDSRSVGSSRRQRADLGLAVLLPVLVLVVLLLVLLAAARCRPRVMTTASLLPVVET